MNPIIEASAQPLNLAQLERDEARTRSETQRDSIRSLELETMTAQAEANELRAELAALHAYAERMRAAILALKKYEESNPPNGYTEWDKYYDALFDAAMKEVK